MSSRNEDEVLDQILGGAREESLSVVQDSNNDMVLSTQRLISSASSSNAQEVNTLDLREEINRSVSLDESNNLKSEMGSASPEELRQQALDEKKKYKILKGEGKSEEALKTFKRGKELERQAEALEISLRKNRKRVLPSRNMADIQNKYGPKDSGQKSKSIPHAGKEKDDLSAELRELGWSDKDLRDEDKKSTSVSLEGDLSSLLGEFSQMTNKNEGSGGIDRTKVVALKKKALMLKREGKIAEAKEELKRAKLLEKQLEEEALLAGAQDSDDELSALIRSMDSDQEESSILYEQDHGFDFDHIVDTSDDILVDGSFEVTDEDMEDPEMADALKSLGWTEESIPPKNILRQSVPVDKEAMLSDINKLKREALNQKRAGNVDGAMANLKKAKLLERDLESLESQKDNVMQNPVGSQKHFSPSTDKCFMSAEVDDGDVTAGKDGSTSHAPKSRLTIQKELLTLKKKALALRREGRLNEAEAELNRGKVLEHQLELMDGALKGKSTESRVDNKSTDLSYKHPDVSKIPPIGEEGDEEDITDQDMHDPTYLSLLRNLGWTDEDNELTNSTSKPSEQDDDLSVQRSEPSLTHSPPNVLFRVGRSKAEVQRELLNLKRKALALRRQRKSEEAEEVLKSAEVLEAQIAEVEAPMKEVPIESKRPKEKIFKPPVESSVMEEDEGDVPEEVMHDPALHSRLKNLGWDLEPVSMQERAKQVAVNALQTTGPSAVVPSSDPVLASQRSKGEIQRELLGLKGKALALRRKGETEKAEETLRMSKVLEAQLEDLEAPKKELLVHVSENKRPKPLESLVTHENTENFKDEVEVNKGSDKAVMSLNDQIFQSSVDSGKVGTVMDNSSFPDSGILIHEKKNPSSVEFDTSEKITTPDHNKTAGTSYIPPSGESVNLVDLLTGDDWSYSQNPAERQDTKINFSAEVSFRSNPSKNLGSQSISDEDVGRKYHVAMEKGKKVNEDEKLNVNKANSVQEFVSQKNGSSLRQEILSHKRQAVALKRKGKLAEAREELRQAKLLEKSLEENNQLETVSSDVSTPSVPLVERREQGVSNLTPKPLSSRDRFKLQQESLGHKRQALKLRREGRVEEAEAEFELAKALETQLEELSPHDDAKSSVGKSEPVDDLVVEDLLDPQLLSALKAIGMGDANKEVSHVPERLEPPKPNVSKSRNSDLERTQLEEQIKAEKVKAVNLKRSGKQAEALDALRRAKLLERNLNS